jgi:hypothetical protein
MSQLVGTTLDRMVSAVEKVRERLLRVSSLLDAGGVPYAVIGGNAVAAWVASVDEAAVRNTRDVDILLRRSDLDNARRVLEAGGFVHRHSAGIDMFLDGPGGKFRDAVHVIFADEPVKSDDLAAAPSVTDTGDAGTPFRVVSLESLVRMKLVAFRDKDRTHLRDFIDIELIDKSWPERFPPDLAARLRQLLETPGG